MLLRTNSRKFWVAPRIYQGLWEMEGGLWKYSVSLSLSLWELCEGNLEGGDPLLGTMKVTYRKALEMGISLHWGPAGDPWGCSLTGDSERWMEEGSGNTASFSVGALWGKPGGRVPLLGTPKDMLSKALEMGICFHMGPILWNMGGHSFPRAFKRRVTFLIRATFMRNLKDM